tara:strand:+ start:1859 stop:3058 length:1200 start_codon:yes stop_codon:yes gene_type:complete
MGSTTKKSKVSASTRGMSPGQSMAMAGNTGLGGVKEKDAVTIQNAIQNINRATGGNQGSSFKDIGQNIGEVGSKYRRPADVENYAKNLSLINDALNQGAGVFETPDGIRRVNFNKTGIKDDQGRTILSKQLPNLNATAPSLGQLGGDMSRALTGYNSLKYTDPSSNIPEMVNTEGLASLVGKAAIPGATAAKIARDLYGTAKNFLFPIEEEEEEDIFSSGADALGGASMFSANIKDTPKVGDEMDQFIRTIGDPYVDPYSSGADATRNLNDIYSSGADAVDIRRNTLDGTRLDQVTEPIQQLPEFLTGSKGSDKPKILQIPNQSGGGEDENENQQSQDSPPNTDPSALELSIRRNLESAGFTSSQIDSILGDLGYQMGGLVPPERGPMSSGVASLFKNK